MNLLCLNQVTHLTCPVDSYATPGGMPGGGVFEPDELKGSEDTEPPKNKFQPQMRS